MTWNVEELSTVVDTGYHLHRELGPGLLESVYKAILAAQLQARGLKVARQHSVPVRFAGLILNEGFRVDLLVEDKLVVELKFVDTLIPVHHKQLLTYLRLMNLPLGLLMNFGAPTFKEGLKRIANDHRNFASSRLRMNQDRI